MRVIILKLVWVFFISIYVERILCIEIVIACTLNTTLSEIMMWLLLRRKMSTLLMLGWLVALVLTAIISNELLLIYYVVRLVIVTVRIFYGHKSSVIQLLVDILLLAIVDNRISFILFWRSWDIVIIDFNNILFNIVCIYIVELIVSIIRIRLKVAALLIWLLLEVLLELL